jgi:AraC-like DNA-binding protein
MPRLIRSACLTGYAELARSVGLDPYARLKEVGLDRSCLFDPDIKIPTDPAIQLLENSANATGMEDFGLRLAETRHLSNLGPIALAIRDAATLREALEANIQYQRLHNEGMLLSLVEVGDAVIFKSELITHRSAARQATELLVAVAHRTIRQLFGGTWRSRPVWLSHAAPSDLDAHLRVFGPWVKFGQECNGTLLDVSDLDAPLAAPDPAMARHVKQYLEPLLAQTQVTISEQVRRLVYDLLASRRASVEQVASRLGMSRRALQRHLVEDGTTFSSIFDDVRVDLARRYVEDRGLALSEVAYLLGFSELSGFSRWFRAQFGRRPMSWRQTERNRAEPPNPGSLVSPQNWTRRKVSKNALASRQPRKIPRVTRLRRPS